MISSIITFNSKLKRPSFEYWSWTAFKLGTLRRLCIIMHPNILNLWIRNICDFNLFSECIAWEIEVCGLGISPCWMVTFSKHYHYFLLVVKHKVPFICFLVISVFNFFSEFFIFIVFVSKHWKIYFIAQIEFRKKSQILWEFFKKSLAVISFVRKSMGNIRLSRVNFRNITKIAALL